MFLRARLETGSELRARPRQTRHHGARRDLERAGDLIVGQTVDDPQLRKAIDYLKEKIK